MSTMYCEKSRPHAYRESALRRALRFAKVDAVKILAPLSKELKLSDITSSKQKETLREIILEEKKRRRMLNQAKRWKKGN